MKLLLMFWFDPEFVILLDLTAYVLVFSVFRLKMVSAYILLT